MIEEKGINEYTELINNKERLEIVGKNIENKRRKLKMTQKQVAEILEMPQQTYSGYEAGRNSPSIETLVRLSFLYKITIDELVGKWEVVSPTYEEQQKILKEIEMNDLIEKIQELEQRLTGIEEEMNIP